jgi:integrase
MKTYVMPHIGDRAIDDIKPSEIIHLLKPIWYTKEETARRVLQRIDSVFVSAITRELRDKASPCTGVARELGNRRNNQVHHAALPYAEVASFVGKLRQRAGPLASRLAFEFLFRPTRSGETRGAAWSRDRPDGPSLDHSAQRMKARAAHIVPLSDRAVVISGTARAALLTDLCAFQRQGCSFLGHDLHESFAGYGARSAGRSSLIRTSFKTWAAETGVRDEVEAALFHTDPNPVHCCLPAYDISR